jgi:maleate isomerase
MGSVADETTPSTADQVGIGVVTPYDFALDRELWRWVPERVSLHLTRTPFEDLPVGVEQALTVGAADTVSDATRSVTIVEPAVVAYGCTSGSFVNGRAGEAALRDAMIGAGARRAVTTSGALVRAIEALGIRSMAVVTPYPDAVGARLDAFLSESGVSVTASRNMGLTGRIWTVPYDVTADLVRTTAQAGGDAVFVSCTNLPTYDVIAPLEAELGRPVLTANQVTMWAALREVGIGVDEIGAGGQTLFTMA